MKVSLVTTAHIPLDDRIFHHFAKTFQNYGITTNIIASTKEFNVVKDGIKIIAFDGNNISKTKKIELFVEALLAEKPDIALCSEPFAIYAAYKYKKKYNKSLKIIFDVTEWYPSKVNLADSSGIRRIIKAIKLLSFNLYTSSLCNAFIFGEYYKSLPYKTLFPFKKRTIIGYYPNLQYIDYTHYPLLKDSITLCFTGKLSKEKGFYDFLKVVDTLQKFRPNLKLKLNIVGWFAYEEDKQYFDNFQKRNKEIDILFNEFLDFHKFIDVIKASNIFFDLRETDSHNHHCLPIKLFYYMAVGRPVVYSNLKAIRKELDISSFGYLVNPSQHEKIASIVLKYIDNPEKYEFDCQAARILAESDYNWASIENELIRFVKNLEHVS